MVLSTVFVFTITCNTTSVLFHKETLQTDQKNKLLNLASTEDERLCYESQTKKNNLIPLIIERHDCQDGSDEYDCDFSSITVEREFLCYKGRDENHRLADCITEAQHHPAINKIAPPHHVITSVSSNFS